jgi:serine/threonine-protein phosphatase 2B regulatory subunit
MLGSCSKGRFAACRHASPVQQRLLFTPPAPAVTVSEVEALRELYRKLSNELHQDNLIHKDEFMWALFKANRDNLFADRVFELFDIKRNSVIEFGEFIRSLSVFHSKAPLAEKAKCECGAQGGLWGGMHRVSPHPCSSCTNEVLLPAHRVPAVAFRIYDIGGNGRIERSELKRFLVALMADNPDVDLDEEALDTIVDQVG